MLFTLLYSTVPESGGRRCSCARAPGGADIPIACCYTPFDHNTVPDHNVMRFVAAPMSLWIGGTRLVLAP